MKTIKSEQSNWQAHLLDKFLHMLPYILFVSLPLYALFLKLLYIRKRKQFYYVDHGLFLIHLYIFTFLVCCCFFFFLRLGDQYWVEPFFSITS